MSLLGYWPVLERVIVINIKLSCKPFNIPIIQACTSMGDSTEELHEKLQIRYWQCKLQDNIIIMRKKGTENQMGLFKLQTRNETDHRLTEWCQSHRLVVINKYKV